MCAAHDDSLTLLSSDVLPPVFKLTALLATGYAVHRSLSPPNPPPAPKTCIDNRTLFERAIRHVTFCSKMMTWTTVLADALVTIHLAFPSAYTYPLASLLLPLPSSAPSILHSSPSPASNSYTHFSPPPPLTAALTAPSLLLLLFALLAAAGALLRLACFRALGPLFTFELTIHPAHTLVTTGPYAHVRHPSYTGVFATLVGATGVMLAPGAWAREAWLAPSLSHAARWVIWLLSASATAAAASSPSSSGVSSAWAPAGEWDAHGHGHGDVQGAIRVPALGALLAWAWVAFWLAKVAYAGRSTMRRVLTEDHELHRVFGPVWEEWAARVRWRLLPGVY